MINHLHFWQAEKQQSIFNATAAEKIARNLCIIEKRLMKSIIIKFNRATVILLGLIVPILTACGPDQLPILLVYGDKGMPNGSLGVYRVQSNEDVTYNKASIENKNGKYVLRLAMAGGAKGNAIIGEFIPSKVANTSDLYVMAFPKLITYSYQYDKNEKKMKAASSEYLNTFLAFKFRNNQIQIWYDFFKNDNENIDFRKMLADSYNKTLTQKPIVLERLGDLNAVDINEVDFVANKIRIREGEIRSLTRE